MGIIKKIVSLLLVVLFLSYYANIFLFPHIHVISGSITTHSHFHTDTHHDTQSGGHTTQCITLIAQISHFNYIDFACDCVPIPQQISLYKNKCVEIVHWVTSIYFKNPSLRAPPILI